MPKAAAPRTEPRIRPARAADLDAVLRIEREHFHRPWSREYLAAELGNRLARFTVACPGRDEEVAGFLLCWRLAGEIELHRIAVASSWLRRGLALSLLDDLLQYGRSRGCGRIVLEVRETNRPAIALYERRGFRRVGRRRDYYSDPSEDALVFALDLGGPAGL